MAPSLPKRIVILIIVVIAQFLCCSTWFAVNAVIVELQASKGIENDLVASATSAVQFGFIIGTLLYAWFTIADRFSPSKVFLLSALAAAGCNLLPVSEWVGECSILVIRFAVGFFLAGIYPVGMKLAADYYEKGLGVSLGYLVGALVLGTALPHLLKGLSWGLSWHAVIQASSLFTLLGGLVVGFFVPDGPYRKKGKRINFRDIKEIFKVPRFRQAAIGYFGHMWELYTFWAYVPFFLALYYSGSSISSSGLSSRAFCIIGIGSLGCVIGGHLSAKLGEKMVARGALLVSGACCVISPFFLWLPESIFLFVTLVWGMAIVTDSPMLSSLVARNAPADKRGTALTIVTCIGFSITILSILVFEWIGNWLPSNYAFIILAIGPMIGLAFLFKKSHKIDELNAG